MLDEALKHFGIDEADIESLGAGSLIANAWAADRPVRLRAGPPIKPSASAMAAPSFEPRDDGGHLHAALAARAGRTDPRPALDADSRHPS